jgi:hypothetical protein
MESFCQQDTLGIPSNITMIFMVLQRKNKRINPVKNLKILLDNRNEVIILLKVVKIHKVL